MKNNRLVRVIVFLSFLFPLLACSLAGDISAQKTAISPNAIAQPANTQPAALALATAIPDAGKPTQTQMATQTVASVPAGPAPSGKLEIASLSSYKDSGGNFHVTGEVLNEENNPVSSIVLTITILDASGKSLLSDSSGNKVDSLTFAPLLENLLPGKTAPFDDQLSLDAGVPDKYDVKVTSEQPGDHQNATLIVQHAQMKTGANRMVYITGEIVNNGDTPVQIYNLAGSLRDKDKKVIAAASTTNCSSYLLPAGDKYQEDRTPFSIAIDDPGTPIDSYSTYVEADQVELLANSPIDITITNNYFDKRNNFHIVGSLTNKSNETQRTFLVGGLYAKDGTVLDADETFTPIDLPAGQSLPYDVSEFNNVNNNTAEMSLVDHFTVQIDRSSTSHPTSQSVELKTSNEQLDKSNNPDWILNGKITNTSNQTLTSETVEIAVYDAKNELVASDWNVINPSSGSIVPGDTNKFNLYVYLDPNVDQQSFTYKTFAAGNVN
jgi:hypothetical protein